MHRQHGLLLDVLYRHIAHVGSAHRFTNRLGIRNVVLVRLHVRLHELRRHQLDRVPAPLKFSRPIVRAAAGFHADQAGLQLGKVFCHAPCASSACATPVPCRAHPRRESEKTSFAKSMPIVVIFMSDAPLCFSGVNMQPLLWHSDAVKGSGRPFH